eukprot:728226-Alexandrium_andersonii.AAC.1
MSASLVGSEMCIRDRYKVFLKLCWRHRRPDGRHVLRTHLSIPGSSSTVSYTHLTLPTICSV